NSELNLYVHGRVYRFRGEARETVGGASIMHKLRDGGLLAVGIENVEHWAPSQLGKVYAVEGTLILPARGNTEETEARPSSGRFRLRDARIVEEPAPRKAGQAV